MRARHARGVLVDEHVVVEVGVTLRVDPEGVAELAPVEQQPFAFGTEDDDGSPGLDRSELVDGALDVHSPEVLVDGLVVQGGRRAVVHVGEGLRVLVVVEDQGRPSGPTLLQHEEPRPVNVEVDGDRLAALRVGEGVGVLKRVVLAL